jgi:hypothetical protein
VKYKEIHREIFIAILLLLSLTNLYAGAWSQKKGHYYTKISYIYSTADGIFGSDIPSLFDNSSIYLYGEYGLLDRLTAIGSLPALKNSVTEANFLRGETTGFLVGDLEVKGRYQFLDAPVVASGVIGVKIPVGYDIYDIPPLGNGETDLDLKLALGASLYPIPAYATGDIGYRLRGGDFVNEFNFSFEVGYTLWNKYLIRFVSDGIEATREAQGESNLIGFPLAQEQIRIGGGLIFILSQNIEIDFLYLKTTSGHNIPKFEEIFFGVAFKK